LSVDLVPCGLAALVREAVEEQRLIAPIRTIRLQVPARPVTPVLADADRMRQVVTNYLTNALRSTTPSVRVITEPLPRED
jgi:signal transduction histidine kinase